MPAPSPFVRASGRLPILHAHAHAHTRVHAHARLHAQAFLADAAPTVTQGLPALEAALDGELRALCAYFGEEHDPKEPTRCVCCGRARGGKGMWMDLGSAAPELLCACSGGEAPQVRDRRPLLPEPLWRCQAGRGGTPSHRGGMEVLHAS